MKITNALLINMREKGPELFTQREDYILSCIASFLKSKGINTKVIVGDYDFLKKKDFGNYFVPEIILFSLDFLNYDVLELISHFRRQFPNVLVAAGGNFATRHHEEILKHFNEFDFIIRGEGDYTFYNLIEGYNKNGLDSVAGITYRKNGKVVVNVPSDELVNIEIDQFADRQVLEDNNLSIAYIASSRGCTRNCSFCCNHVFWMPEKNYKWKGRSAKATVDEIEYVHNTYKIQVFNFVDSSFEDPGVSNERMREIAAEIIRRNMKIAFFVNFRVFSIKHIDFDETIDILKKAGLVGVFFGVETANEADKKLYKKALDSNLSVQAVNYFKNKGLSYSCGFINLNPYSTIDNLKENNELLRSLKLGSYFLFRSKLRVYKGTPLFESIKKDGLLRADKYYNYDFEFLNKNVEIVSEGIEKFLTSEENKWFVDRNRYYCKYYPQNLKILLHFYPQLQDEIFEQERILMEYVDERNEVNCDMFERLLTAAERSGFNAQIAEDIIYSLDCETAKEKLKFLEMKKLYLYKNLAKENPDKQIFKTLF